MKISKKVLGVTIAVVVALGVAIATLAIMSNYNKDAGESVDGDADKYSICSKDIVTRSAALIKDPTEDNLIELGDKVESIITNTKYADDINCVYIVLKYNDLIASKLDTKEAYGMYEALYGSSHRVSSVLKSGVDIDYSPEVIQQGMVNGMGDDSESTSSNGWATDEDLMYPSLSEGDIRVEE